MRFSAIVALAAVVPLRAPALRLFGSLDLPDDALAVTLADSRGLLRLADSFEVDVRHPQGARERRVRDADEAARERSVERRWVIRDASG